MKLAGRVALVTGSGRRVGQAIALALGSRGMKIAVHYNGSASGAEDTVAQLAAAGAQGRIFQADLSEHDAPAALIDEVARSFGALDVLVNSAAVMMRTPF